MSKIFLFPWSVPVWVYVGLGHYLALTFLKSFPLLARLQRVSPRQNRSEGPSRQTPVITMPRLKRRNVSVSMVNMRNNKGQHEKKMQLMENLRNEKVHPLQKLIY